MTYQINSCYSLTQVLHMIYFRRLIRMKLLYPKDTPFRLLINASIPLKNEKIEIERHKNL